MSINELLFFEEILENLTIQSQCICIHMKLIKNKYNDLGCLTCPDDDLHSRTTILITLILHITLNFLIISLYFSLNFIYILTPG